MEPCHGWFQPLELAFVSQKEVEKTSILSKTKSTTHHEPSMLFCRSPFEPIHCAFSECSVIQPLSALDRRCFSSAPDPTGHPDGRGDVWLFLPRMTGGETRHLSHLSHGDS